MKDDPSLKMNTIHNSIFQKILSILSYENIILTSSKSTFEEEERNTKTESLYKPTTSIKSKTEP